MTATRRKHACGHRGFGRSCRRCHEARRYQREFGENDITAALIGNGKGPSNFAVEAARRLERSIEAAEAAHRSRSRRVVHEGVAKVSASDCPDCPACKEPYGMPGPSGTLIVCGGCGVLWEGTAAERAQADAADAAFVAECEEERKREAEEADRERARALFIAAGKPVPAWLRGEPS